MSSAHKDRTGRWLDHISEGPDALLRLFLLELAGASPAERPVLARTFVAFVTGPRVRDGFARRLMRCAAVWQPGSDEVVASSPQLFALRKRKDALTRQLDRRLRSQTLGPLLRQRDDLSRENGIKREALANLHQAFVDVVSEDTVVESRR